MAYGLNFLYLARTRVAGVELQEAFPEPNLAFSYRVTHYPVYVVSKATFETPWNNKNITVDVGLGPNFMKTTDFQQLPLNDYTEANQDFAGKSSTTLSLTTGISMQFKQALLPAPVVIEIGYRFFYLGEGKFLSLNSQNLGTLNTGQNIANAVILSLIF